jgi:predicted lipid-binding transport protein (Tim44 family)
MKSLFLPLAALSLTACIVRVPVSEQPAPRPAYSQSSPYATPLPPVGYASQVPADPYCAEAAGEAQDAAAIASTTGRGRDIARAERTGRDARRNCR